MYTQAITTKIRNLLRVPAVLCLSLLFSLCLSACAPNTGLLSGGSWQLSSLQHQHIRLFEEDFKNSQLLYASDTQNGVFVTTDGGQHWTSHNTGLPLPDTLYALSFDSIGKKLYLATAKGLFVSADAAQHWTVVGTTGTVAGSLPADSITALAFDTTAPHTIYVGTAHQGVFASTNDGMSWTAINNSLPSDLAINGLTFNSEHHQLWVATASGVYRSNDKGATWQALNTGLPTNSVVYTVRLASMSGGTEGLIFAGTNHGFFRSQDSGAHWSSGEESLAGTSVRFILIDFRTPTTLYVGTDAGAFRSDDSGQNWSGVGPGLPRGQAVYALILGATNFTQLYAAANDVYLYPGTSGGFDFIRLLPFLFFLLMFYMLYRFTRRGRKRRADALKPERIVEPSAPKKADETSA